MALLLSVLALFVTVAAILRPAHAPPSQVTLKEPPEQVPKVSDTACPELDELRREVRKLEAELAAIKRAQDIQNAPVPPQPVVEETEEEIQRKTEEAKVHAVKKLDDLLSSQGRDPSWSDAQETRIKLLFEEGSLKDIKVERISCGMTLCLVTVQGAYDSSRIVGAISLGGSGYVDSSFNPEPHGRTSLYLMRKGFDLPPLGP